MNAELRVLIADDHAIVRSGLRALLAGQSGVRVVGEASNGKEAVELVRSLVPDVVVMDIRMPLLNGVDAVRQALAIHPGLKVIGLSADPDERLAVELMRAGASGFVRKEAAFEDLVLAIRAAMGNNSYCNSAVIAKMARRGVEPRASAFELLSERERELLQLIAEGNTTKEISAALNVSVKTVETHRRNLLAKLNVRSIAELTKYAVREGLTPL